MVKGLFLSEHVAVGGPAALPIFELYVDYFTWYVELVQNMLILIAC